MPNPPIPLSHFVQLETMLGLLYGFAMMLVLIKPKRSSSMRWSLLIIAGGFAVLGACHHSEAGAMVAGEDRASSRWMSDWALRHTWVLAVLVCLTRVFENLRLKTNRFGSRHCQFLIMDLIAIVTGSAVLIASVRHTSLIEHGPVFWLGILVIAWVVPWSVVGLRIGRGSTLWRRCSLVIASVGLLVAGLAWAESSLVQPGKIGFAEAATRYGWLIAAMIAPRLIEQSLALARRSDLTRLPPSVVGPGSQPILDADCLETQSDAHPDPFSMPRDVSRRTDTRATSQAQRRLNLIV